MPCHTPRRRQEEYGKNDAGNNKASHVRIVYPPKLLELMPSMRQPWAWMPLLIGILAARAQVRDSALHPDYAAHLEVIVQLGDTDEVVPARIYLFRSGEPHRLSPIDNLLPLVQDNFYR